MRRNVEIPRVSILGAGLAGSEAALQLARRGIAVDLFEMRPRRMTEAHVGGQCAELVCSNSFGSASPGSASGILKSELRALDAQVLATAFETRVPAGESLAVDRTLFAATVTERVKAEPLVTYHEQEISKVPEGIVVMATGPLTTPALCEELAKLIGAGSLYFYDAISPIVATESLNLEAMFLANRYDKGESKDFLNIPLSKEQYESFLDDILAGEVMLPHDFEQEKYFEGCMPIEAMAARGRQTLSFGPMKPVGLADPKTGKRAYAVIQLRRENQHGTAYNLVGFQTKLKYGEQQRIFRKLPGLANAEFLRLGSMHRNTYVDSPRCLEPTLQLKREPRVFLAGQITGTEGYLESTATGLIAARGAASIARGERLEIPPPETMLGALLRTITDPCKENFQPINSNFGILPPLSGERQRDKKARNALYAARSEAAMIDWLEKISDRQEFVSLLSPASTEPTAHP